MNNLEIGGENLLVGSKEISNVSYGNTQTTGLDNGFTAVKCTLNWNGVGILANDLITKGSVGDEFTFSVNVISSSTVFIHFYAMCYDSNNQRVYPTLASGQLNNKQLGVAPDYYEDKRYYITFQITQGWMDLINAGGTVKWTMQVSGGATTDTPVYLYAPKLERGNKATDWSLSKEDIYNGLYDASKTATNYMNFSSSGLIIGDMTANTLGKNVRIDNDSVDIRNDSTILASFGATDIYLGKNSETSVINLCNGAATMRVKDNTDFRIYTDKRLVMSAYSSMLLDCWRDSTHMTRISIQSSDPDSASTVGGVQFTIYDGSIQNTVRMLKNNIELQVTDGTNETRFNVDEKVIKAYASEIIRLNSKNRLQIGEASTYTATILLGNSYNRHKSVDCYWGDNAIHEMFATSADGKSFYIGPPQITINTSSVLNTITYVRGRNVRLYAHEGGAVYLGSSGSTTVTSDRNMKKDILDIDDKYIDFFDRLRPITYKYNNGHRDHIGFIAQEVEEALNDSGLTTEQFAGLVIDKDIALNPNYEENNNDETHYDTLYSLRYEEFISLLVKKVQDLQKQINELKGE